MKHIFLEGKTIHLRALEEQDLKGSYFQWLNDSEVCEFNSHATFPNTELKMKSYFDSVNNSSQNVVLAIIDSESDTHIGNISLQGINWISRSAEFAILLGDKNFWNKGIASEAARLICNYGFERLNLNRIYCGTAENNIGMQKLAAKLHMKKEGERREAIFKNGSYFNIYEYGVLKNEFEN